MSVLCCGVIPLREMNKIEVLVLLHRSGNYWGFPKGHANEGETPMQAAARELQEETGLEVDHFVPSLRYEEEYSFLKEGNKIEKKVIYFPAWVKGLLLVQNEEILKAEWLEIETAMKRVTFDGNRAICKKLLETKIA